MTRAKVIQLGLAVLALGGLGYEVFSLLGFDAASAGIAAEALLFAVVVVWTGSYLLRVVTGKMTYMEQRRRYRESYENLTTAELQARFDAMSEQEQMALLEELEHETNAIKASSDS
ncbi:MAG: DUF3007 family protein [Prochlorococcus sp.]|nr:DUF3007 family protein [Prochlorococcus sp.]